MKIWHNNKRVIEDSNYMFCSDCCLLYTFPDYSQSTCLATHFEIKDTSKMCLNGYKYEINV